MAFSRIIAVAVLFTSLIGHAQTAHVTQYICRINARTDGSAHVSASIRFFAPDNQLISLVIRRLGDGDVTKLDMRDGSGQPLVMQPRNLVSGTSFTTSSASGRWSVNYDVLPTSGVVNEIPLPVPSLSLPPGDTAEIVLKIPPDDVLYGDSFPRMTVDSNGDAHATVLGVPSLAWVHHKPARQISFGESFLTSSNLANLAMLILLFLGLNILRRKLVRSSTASEK